MKKHHSHTENSFSNSNRLSNEHEISKNNIKSSPQSYHQVAENDLIENLNNNANDTPLSKSITFKLSETSNFNTNNFSISSNLFNNRPSSVISNALTFKTNNFDENKQAYTTTFDNIKGIENISNHSPAKLSIKCNNGAFEKVQGSEIEVSSRKDSSVSDEGLNIKENNSFNFVIDSNIVELSQLQSQYDCNDVKQIINTKNDEIKILSRKCSNLQDKIGFLNDEIQKARNLISSLQNNLNVTEELNEFLEISIAKLRLDHSNEVDTLKNQIKSFQKENTQIFEKLNRASQFTSNYQQDMQEHIDRIKSQEYQLVVKDNLISQLLQKNIVNFHNTQNDLEKDSMYLSELDNDLDFQLKTHDNLNDPEVMPLKVDVSDECRKNTKVMKSICHNIYIGPNKETTDKVINIIKPYESPKAKQLVFINVHKRKMICNKKHINNESFQQNENQETTHKKPQIRSHTINTNNIKIKEVHTSFGVNSSYKNQLEIIPSHLSSKSNSDKKVSPRSDTFQNDQSKNYLMNQKSAFKETSELIQKQNLDVRNFTNTIDNYQPNENSYKDFNSISNMSLSGFQESKTYNQNDQCDCDNDYYDTSSDKINENQIHTESVAQYLSNQNQQDEYNSDFIKNIPNKNYGVNMLANEVISEVTETSSTINDISNLRETVDSNSAIESYQLKNQLSQNK